MQIIISPAKKMNQLTDGLDFRDLPFFLTKTEQILDRLQGMCFEELKTLWRCSDKLARQNYDRLRQMDLRQGLTPAVLSYEGIQYHYMAPAVFSDAEYEYIQEHLRILSGFYGVLRPFDGVRPYRLEMQAKLEFVPDDKTNEPVKNLYEFWGDSIASRLAEETDCILDLASKEYSISVSRYLPETCRKITCVFGEVINGKIVEKGTLCKMARGEMVRRMAENKICDPEEIKTIMLSDYEYAGEYSDENRYVFLKRGK